MTGVRGIRRAAVALRARGDGGMVTAETAVALPALMVLVCAAVSAVTVATAQLRCVDAAREGARAAARGDSGPVVRADAVRAAPPGSAVTVSTAGGTAQVVVTARVAPLGGLLPDVRVRARAVAAREPGRP